MRLGAEVVYQGEIDSGDYRQIHRDGGYVSLAADHAPPMPESKDYPAARDDCSLTDNWLAASCGLDDRQWRTTFEVRREMKALGCSRQEIHSAMKSLGRMARDGWIRTELRPTDHPFVRPAGKLVPHYRLLPMGKPDRQLQEQIREHKQERIAVQ